MTRRIWKGRCFDPLLIVCGLLGTLLFAPLLQPGLPQAPDAVLHLYRSAILRLALDYVVFWPRCPTLFHQGYGYPVLNFQAPLLYVLTVLASYVTSDLTVALKVGLVFACLLYPVGMYLWARAILGRLGAIVAATAYTFAAFRFRELYFLGGYPQFLAWSLYPLVFFFFLELARRPSAGRFLGAVLTLAGAVAAHNIGAMLFGPVVAAYLVVLIVVYRKQRAWVTVSAAVACAALVSAIFWLPALGEMEATQVRTLTQGYFDVSLHFVRLADLAAAMQPLDARAVNPVLPFTFGRWHLVLAGAGALTIFRRGGARFTACHLGAAVVVVAGCVFMMLPPSLPVWRNVPLIAFAEYPWRLFGVAFLGSSLLAGAAMDWFRGPRSLQRIAACIAMAGLLLAVAVYQFPRPFLAIGATADDYLVYETAFRGMGTTGADEFLSRWTEKAPDAPALQPGKPRIALLDPPDGVTAVVHETRTRSLKLAVWARQSATVTVAQFYFPGWSAWVDGERVEVWPAPQSGLIQLAIPAGEHMIWLDYQGTLVQRIAGWLSAGGGLMTIMLARWLRCRPYDLSAR